MVVYYTSYAICDTYRLSVTYLRYLWNMLFIISIGLLTVHFEQIGEANYSFNCNLKDI